MCTRNGSLLARIDWGDAGWGDAALEFAQIPLAAVPFVMTAYEAEAPGRLGDLPEARIIWDRLDYALQALPHHYNVLFDSSRGWIAIDPTGVVGELEYEMGAARRNPYERPELLAEPNTIQKRVQKFARELGVDHQRVLAWALLRLSSLPSGPWKNGFAIESGNSSIALANAIRPMLEDVSDS